MDTNQEIDRIIAEAKGLAPAAISNPWEEEAFKKRFSLGALAYNFFYFQAMHDTLFMWLSIIFSMLVYTIPLLFVLAYLARGRAWETREWESFAEFEAAQKKWDRSAWYGLAGFMIAAFILIKALGPLLSQSAQNLNVDPSKPVVPQLNQTIRDLQE